MYRGTSAPSCSRTWAFEMLAPMKMRAARVNEAVKVPTWVPTRRRKKVPTISVP